MASSLNKAPVVFIDEIHRFNKAQQDALLPIVESGKIILIGATTENPSFEVIAPLISRTRVLIFNLLSEKELEKIIIKAAETQGVGFEKPEVLDFLIQTSNGDARIAINTLEVACGLLTSSDNTDNVITKDILKQAFQRYNLNFDLKGEEYYNIISAFHKSIRGSDPNASLYYLARMLSAGQDPLYIARRLIRAASEDIGCMDNNALAVCVSAFDACNKLGMPECSLALAQAVYYLAKSPKSNKLYLAYKEAEKDATEFGNLPVPLHIRNAPTKLMKDWGYSKGYSYHHSKEGKKIESINYLPDKLVGRDYFKDARDFT
jgi:putative ATPase